jgi:hypothetical protein
MTKKLELQLQEKYPRLLKNLYGDMKETCLAWGLEVPDEMYDLINDLFALLNHWGSRCPIKNPQTLRYDYPEDKIIVVIEQVKLKFDSLRVYYSIENNFTQEDIDFYGEDTIKSVVEYVSNRTVGSIDMAERFWDSHKKLIRPPQDNSIDFDLFRSQLGIKN